MIFDAVVVGAGETVSGQYDMSNINVYAADKFYDAFSPADGSGNYSITNWGTISFTSSLVSPYNYSISLIYLEGGYGNWTITNHNQMSVSNAHGFAWGVRSDGWTPDFENTGTFTVSWGQQAIGIEAWGLPLNNLDGLSFKNSGTFSVSGDEAAFGLYLPNGGVIVNTGDILVSSQAGGHTFAVDFAAQSNGSIYNSGRIIATDQDDTTQLATAIIFFGNGGFITDALTIVNDGEITGERAIIVDTSSGNEVSGLSAAQSVINHGTINGLIQLSLGDDTIVNSGTIIGEIDLGGDNDTYDGRGGHASGPVEGYDGDDTFYAGKGAESYFGETGNDHFFVAGGVASFDGGDGSDTVDFALINTVLAVNLMQTAQAFAAGRQLSITAVENVSGSAYGDTLTGNDAANSLWGVDGNDTLAGGNGNDRLFGDTGDDAIDGGGDNDNLYGDAGLDILSGGDGNDYLSGGAGADKMTGGAGADIFFFEKGDGRDIITDFNVSTDIIDLGSDDGYSSYAASQSGKDVLVTLADGDSLLLQNVSLASLSSSNFILLDPSPRNLMGTAGDDLLTGGINNDILNGGAGNDTLRGGRGNDLLVGGKGADAIDGGAGMDTVSYESESETVIVSLNGGYGIIWTPQGGSWDTLYNVENIIGTNSLSLGETLAGDDGTNSIWARAGDDVLEGNGGDDKLYGESGNDRINGEAGNDILDGGAGTDQMAGGQGNDTYYYTPGDTITELAGEGGDTVISAYSYTLGQNVENVTLTGTGNLQAVGNALANTLTGNSGSNKLTGGAGNDILNGGGGADILIGGLGNDTYYVDNVGDVVTELASQGTDTIVAAIDYSLTSANIENLTLTGSSNLNATGNALANVLTGNSGNNVLNGGAGADTMIGGAGNDTYYVDSFSDVVTELKNAGTDTVYSSVQYIMGGSYVENATLTGTLNSYAVGNALDNILYGNSGNNNLTGGAGNDRLDGGAGADGLRGGVGNDVYYVDNLGDFIVENKDEGTDLVYSTVSFNLGAQYIENLTLTGSGNINGLGNALANTIIGNTGNNLIDGRQGADRLTGGVGADIFFFGAGSGKDTITDFSASQNDSLNLHAYSQVTAVITQVGNDTVIDLGGGNIITLTGALKADVISHITW